MIHLLVDMGVLRADLAVAPEAAGEQFARRVLRPYRHRGAETLDD